MFCVQRHENPCSDFTKSAYKYLPEKDAKRLLSTYNIPQSSEDVTSIRHLLGDCAYHFPVIRAAAAWPHPEKCFVFHLDRANILHEDPPPRGLATQVPDASFHFLNMNHSLSELDQKLVTEMAGRWIAFANGEDPWTPHGKKKNAMCVTDGGEFIIRTEKEDRKRTERRWDKWDVVLDIGVEKVWKIISVYLAQFDMDERRTSLSNKSEIFGSRFL